MDDNITALYAFFFLNERRIIMLSWNKFYSILDPDISMNISSIKITSPFLMISKPRGWELQMAEVT